MYVRCYFFVPFLTPRTSHVQLQLCIFFHQPLVSLLFSSVKPVSRLLLPHAFSASHHTLGLLKSPNIIQLYTTTLCWSGK